MRNLIHARETDLDDQPTLRPIPRQQRPLTDKAITRSIRRAGAKERTVLLGVARAMKGADA